MLKKSIPDPIQIQKKVLNEKIQQARDNLKYAVRSALAYSQLLSILPEESKEYESVKEELDDAKETVAVQISAYEKYRKELDEFCQINDIHSIEWVVNGYTVAMWAIREK